MSGELNEEELAQLATSGGGASLPPGSETNAIIDYYCRQHMWRHVTKAATEALNAKRGDERETRFWRAIGYAEEGSYTEAIRELEPLQTVTELSLAVTAALINTHKLAKVKDKDALEKLKEKLKTLSKTSDDRSLVVAGRYFWHADKAKQARQCIEKVLTKSRRNIDALTILGWINLTSGNSRFERKCLTLFDTVIKLTADKKDIGALLGRARYHEKRAKYDRVLEDLNTVIVMWPDFKPAVVEKARVLMIMNNWEESVATAHRVLRVDKDDIGALRLHVLYLLTRESRALTIANRLTDLTEALDRTEPKNHRLYYEISQLCARLTNRRRNLLQQTLALIERACKLDPINSAYITEQGYQLMLLEEYSQASMCFNEASKLDEGNLHALHGRIKCKILQQNYKEAEQELEFLQEIQSSIGSNSDLKFLDALLAWNKDHNESKSVTCLQEAITEHSKMLESVPAGYEYFIAYNPEFVLEAVTQLMQHIGTEPMQPGDPPNNLLTISIKLLNQLTDLVPGLLGAQLLLSKVNFIAGEFDASERALVTCLKLEPQCAPAHIIQAQICLARENYKQCSQSLEQARSLDFEIRNTPVYHLLKSRLLEASGQTEEALKTLEAAMELPGVKRIHSKNPLPLQERISLFLELASIHAKLQHLPEATKIMSDARHEFKDTSESVRITIADADLAIKRRDFDTALSMLRTIPHDSPHYTRGKMKMAEIYLSYRKNKKLYTACFQEMANSGNNVHNYLLLGEAYMKIQEPEKAIQAYEDALKLNPEDPILASRIGRALITTHDYARAVQYYETAAKGDPSKVYLFHELAQLYLSLKHYDQSLRVIGNALALTAERKSPDGAEDIQSMMYDVTSHSIAADVHQGAGDIEGAKNSLTAAWSLQSNVLASLRAENPDAKREQRELAASLCYRLAELYLQSKMEEKAIQFYNEALKHNDSHEKSRLALARLHLINNELDACQHQCVTLMRIDPNNREASMMLADLMFRKNEHEAATYHFQQLLEKNPTRYEALNKLIQLLRRAGRLSDAPRFLKLAEKFNPHAQSAAGLHYCKGLYHWYTNDPREALIQFNYARKDGEWGRQAIMNMIEIYLNPDNMDLFQETAEAKGDNSDHIMAAEKLLKELTSMGEKSAKYVVLESYALMASKQKPRIEKALSNLMALATSDRDHVPSLLGMANAYMLLGQPPKARNQLKRISKMKLDPEYAQDFERAWLMLAEMYIQVSKFEFATELCKKTLNNNKSNAKAWEQLGMIMEKEQAYRDASDHYEHAWRFMNESSPTIGFKLAFNYLKAKRYVEAIDVCHKVLTQYPDYPKIRKEILEKARQALRP